ncbi:SHOCT domain-containing protein [Anaerovorax sp. IOR16]|uniref:SHOCT domain-containing protein n=1 Tax=Anaerovorax sp. IOR16 TaxID=2773458 RepID=UPI0019D0B0D0|nr:SHOCT domain-containing protein [Anaerovorax sp. IOR16]
MMYGYNGIGRCFGAASGFMYGGLGMTIMLGLIALTIIGIFFLAKKKRRHHSDNAALEALKMKLAMGEISEEEYNKRKMILD